MTKDQGQRDIFLFGSGGHAKVIADIVERQGEFRIVGLLDDDRARHGSTVFGYRVLGGRTDLAALGLGVGIVAVGSNSARRKIAEALAGMGVDFVSAIHPGAWIARGATIGLGTVVMAGAVINSDAEIGRHAIVNTGASVDHDCVVGDFAHIAPKATLCGTVRVGPGAMVGAGSTVIENRTVGYDCVIGAGATVVRDVPPGAKVLGTPAARRT